MDHVYFDAMALQASRGLQSEQAAAYHDGSTMIITCGLIDHAAGIVNGPEGEDAREQLAP